MSFVLLRHCRRPRYAIWRGSTQILRAQGEEHFREEGGVMRPSVRLWTVEQDRQPTKTKDLRTAGSKGERLREACGCRSIRTVGAGAAGPLSQV